MEVCVRGRATPYTEGLAGNGMGMIARHIRTACAEPENRAAREAMMLGATTAGMAFSNASVALVHGMSRPIGAFFHVPHGLSNAMLLPEITAFSAPAALERYADCAKAMAVAAEGEGNQSAAARLIHELRALNADLSLPSPRHYGLRAASRDGKPSSVVIEGEADGASRRDAQLAAQRATTVAGALKAAGVDPSEIAQHAALVSPAQQDAAAQIAPHKVTVKLMP